jgi:protein-tyrosine phosphatase
MIDLHAHLLPGLDDGPSSLAGSLDMARAAHAAGIHTMVCTPHIVDRYPTEPRRALEQLEVVREALGVAGVPLRVVPGAEIAVPHVARLDDDDLLLASIGGAGRWLLLEMPYQGWPLALPALIGDLEMRGYGVIVAHPERAESIQRAPDRMRELVGRGALVQLTAGSFLGDHGPAAQRAALMLLAGGVAHFLASDAHSAGPWRGPELEEGLQAAADAIDVHPQALRWMVEDGPAAVIEGRPVRPPRFTPRRRPRVGAPPAPAGPRQRTPG